MSINLDSDNRSVYRHHHYTILGKMCNPIFSRFLRFFLFNDKLDRFLIWPLTLSLFPFIISLYCTYNNAFYAYFVIFHNLIFFVISVCFTEFSQIICVYFLFSFYHIALIQTIRCKAKLNPIIFCICLFRREHLFLYFLCVLLFLIFLSNRYCCFSLFRKYRNRKQYLHLWKT